MAYFFNDKMNAPAIDINRTLELKQLRFALSELNRKITAREGNISELCGKKSDLLKEIAALTLPELMTA